MIRTDVEIELRKWLVIRFEDSWWTPNFTRMIVAMIAHGNIIDVDGVKSAAKEGTLEEVITLHLNRMTKLVKKSKHHTKLNDVCED